MASSLAENTIVSPPTGWPPAFFTVAVAILVEVPLATIELGDSRTETVAAAGVAVAGATNSDQLAAVAPSSHNPHAARYRAGVRSAKPPKTGTPALIIRLHAGL
jgi:hypothetical protein